MSNDSQRDIYGIGYREETTERLHMRNATTHARFFLPYLSTGMNLLDGGCGPGAITADLANVVSPGKVTGIDVDESQITAARANAVENGVTNVSFQVGSLYKLPFPDESFDAVFSHAVMEHLSEPLTALQEMKRVLKKEGIIGVRCGDTGAFMIAPADPDLQQVFNLWEKVYWHHGREPRFGRFLLGMLRKAGFSRIRSSASSDLWTESPESTAVHAELVATVCEDSWFAEQVIELGFADRRTLDNISNAWRAVVKNPDVFISEARGEAVGWKE